jgi:very-short-patch-repair endonuclease
MAWPSVRLVIEFDGHAYHGDPAALHRDRAKANAAAVCRWRLIRFTWFDVMHRPEHVIAIVRKALSGR